MICMQKVNTFLFKKNKTPSNGKKKKPGEGAILPRTE